MVWGFAICATMSVGVQPSILFVGGEGFLVGVGHLTVFQAALPLRFASRGVVLHTTPDFQNTGSNTKHIDLNFIQN